MTEHFLGKEHFRFLADLAAHRNQYHSGPLESELSDFWVTDEATSGIAAINHFSGSVVLAHRSGKYHLTPWAIGPRLPGVWSNSLAVVIRSAGLARFSGIPGYLQQHCATQLGIAPAASVPAASAQSPAPGPAPAFAASVSTPMLNFARPPAPGLFRS